MIQITVYPFVLYLLLIHIISEKDLLEESLKPILDMIIFLQINLCIFFDNLCFSLCIKL